MFFLFLFYFFPTQRNVISITFLSEGQERELEQISGDQASDSTFVHKFIQFMYEGEEREKLKYRSLTGVAAGVSKYESGKTFYRAPKEPMTPEKRLAVNTLFRNRVHKSTVSSMEKHSRSAPPYINHLIATAFGNLRRTVERLDDKMSAVAEKRARLNDDNY